MNGCCVSVYGTDCPIQEPSPFSPSLYRFKTKSAGLRYETAIAISSGKLFRAHGPFPAGSYPDLRIIRSGLKLSLDVDETVVADKGYPDERALTPPGTGHPDATLHSKIRARHETVIRRLKHFFTRPPLPSSL